MFRVFVAKPYPPSYAGCAGRLQPLPPDALCKVGKGLSPGDLAGNVSNLGAGGGVSWKKTLLSC